MFILCRCLLMTLEGDDFACNRITEHEHLHHLCYAVYDYAISPAVLHTEYQCRCDDQICTCFINLYVC